MRYRGQAYELTIPVRNDLASIETLSVAFGDEHFRTYGHKAAEDTIELVNIRLFAEVDAHTAESESLFRGQKHSGSATDVRRERRAYFGPDHGLVSTAIISRADLQAGPREGPLIVEEYDSTCVVPPGSIASVDSWDNIHIVLQN